MRILKNKDFRRLMFGNVTSMLGSNMQQFALSLYVLAITGSASIFASIIAISILPRLILSPIAGVFGDWFDRKRSIISLDLFNGVLIGSYALYYLLNDGLSLLSIYLLVIVLEIVEIFFGCSMAPVVPSMIEKDQIMEANSVKSMLSSFANLLAPLLASALYALVGMQVLLIFNAVSFFVSAICEMTINIPKHHSKPIKVDFKSFKKDMIDGIKLVKNNRMMKLIVSLGVFINFSLGALFSVGLIFIIFDVMHATEIQYGLISTVMGTSMFIAPLFIGKVLKKIKIGKMIILTFAFLDILIFLIAFLASDFTMAQFDTNLLPLLFLTVITFATGLLVTFVNIGVGTLFDTMIPLEYMGRASSILNLGLMIAMPVGQMLYGVGLDISNASIATGGVGVVLLIAVLYFRKPFIESDRESGVDNATGEAIKTDIVKEKNVPETADAFI